MGLQASNPGYNYIFDQSTVMPIGLTYLSYVVSKYKSYTKLVTLLVILAL